MKAITHLTGGPGGSQEPASSLKASRDWRPLPDYTGHKGAEEAVAQALERDFDVTVTRAGERSQSYDIEVSLNGFSDLDPRLYEVKSLWRRNERCTFDRRIKVGTRGETIYGRRDAQIKSFALSLEEGLAGFDADANDVIPTTREFIDAALSRRHSKSFHTRLRDVAAAVSGLQGHEFLVKKAHAIISGSVGADDIVRGFDDISGIFVVAGPIYTLVTKAEIAEFFTFDSASSEGPRLRLHGVIPSERQRPDDTKRQEKNE